MPLITTQSAKGFGFGRIMTSPSVPNSFDSIETVAASGTSVTLGAGGTIPQGYKHLQIRFTWNNAVGDQSLLITFNGVGGTSYAVHGLGGSGSGDTFPIGGANLARWETCYDGNNSGSTSNTKVGIIDILDYSATNKTKTSKMLWGADYNGSGRIALETCLFNSTNAITSITFAPFSTSFASGSSFALYGIEG